MHKACPPAALAPGESMRLKTLPPVAVFHTGDGELFAIDDTCTHPDASLAEVWVEGGKVERPLHAAKFNLRTARADAPPAKLSARTREVSVIDGYI